MQLKETTGKEDTRRVSLLVLFGMGMLAGYAALHNGGFPETARWIVSFAPVAFLFLLLSNKKRAFILPPRGILTAWAVLILWMCFCAVFSSNPNASIGEILLGGGFLLSGLIIFALTDTERSTNALVGMLLVGAATVTIYGWVGYLIGRFSPQGGHEMIRHFIGPFYWKNPMAGYLILFLPLAIISAIKYRKIPAILSAVLAATMFGGLILTRSRGGWLAFAIAIFAILLPALLVRKTRSAKWLMIAGIIVVGLILGLGFAPSSALKESAQSFSSVASPEIEGQSAVERIAMLEAGLRIIGDYPIVGIGPGSWAFVRAAYLTTLDNLPKYPHNIYLRIAAELGIPGLILFMIALVASFVSLVISAYKKSTDLLLVAISTGIAASLIHMAVDFDAAFAGIVLPLAILAGLGQRLRCKDHSKLSELDWGKSLSLILSIIILLLLAGRFASESKLGEGRERVREMEYELAKSAFKEAIIFNPLSWQAEYALARTSLQTLDLGGARQEIDAALRLAPTIPELHRFAGSVYTATGDTNAGIEFYRNSIALAPRGSAESYIELAALFHNSGRLQDAANVLLTMTGALEPFAGKKYTSQTVSFRYKIAEGWRRLAEISMVQGDTTMAILAAENAEKFSKLREKDYPMSMLGIETGSPELVVCGFFNALDLMDTVELRELVFDREGPLPRIEEGLRLKFGRVLDIREDPIAGLASVDFIMVRTDSARTVRIPSTLDLVFDESKWKIAFKKQK